MIKDDEVTTCVTNFRNEILSIFKVDKDDDELVHPKLVCSKHRNVLYRARAAAKSQTSLVPESKFLSFYHHDDNSCTVCKDSFPEAAHKRKKLACPGRVYKNWQDSIEIEPTDMDADRCFSYFKSLKKCSRETFIHELVTILSPEEQEQLAGEVSGRIHKNVCEKAESLTSVYQDINTLAFYSIEKFIGDCDKSLLAFNISARYKGTIPNHVIYLLDLSS